MAASALPRPHLLLVKLTTTRNERILLIVRLILGVVMFAHGAQKVFGWFGGPGLPGSLGLLTSPPVNAPAVLAVISVAVEFLGAIALLLGLFGRVAALGIACNMVAAVLLVHLPNGFFMNWAGNQKGEGFEYHLLALALCLVTMTRGSGRWSLDRFLMHQEYDRMGIRHHAPHAPLIARPTVSSSAHPSTRRRVRREVPEPAGRPDKG